MALITMKAHLVRSRSFLGLALPIVLALLASDAMPGEVSLAWDPVPDSDIAGYEIWYGTTTGSYDQSVDVGNSTSATISDLPTGVTHFLVVIARNSAGLESLPSNEVSALVGLPVNQPPLASITYPTADAALTALETVTMTASANDPDGIDQAR